MSDLWLVVLVWFFIGHIHWIKSGVVHFQYLVDPPKTLYVLAELGIMPAYWLMGPIAPYTPIYYKLHPGVTNWGGLSFRYYD